MQLPSHFGSVSGMAWQRAHAVPGAMDADEFLAMMMLAAAAPAEGVIVEVGSLMGRSTVGLATMAQMCDWGKKVVVSIDRGEEDTWQKFKGVLLSAGVQDQVEGRQARSLEAVEWQRPIRLLSIAGTTDYAEALEDFRHFSPFLLPGGLLAIHGTLVFGEGPIRVFVEEVLRSDRFGAAGFLLNIGWAHHQPPTAAQREARENLAEEASALLPLVAPPRQESGMNGLRYRMARGRIPNQVPPADEWAAGIS